MRANICLARVHLRDGVRNVAEAKHLLSEAKKGMRPWDLDYLADELDDLEAHLACSPAVPEQIVLNFDDVPVVGMKAWLHSAEVKALDAFATRFGHNIAKLAKLTGLDRREIRRYFRECDDQRLNALQPETHSPRSAPPEEADTTDQWSTQ